MVFLDMNEYEYEYKNYEYELFCAQCVMSLHVLKYNAK